MSAKEAAKTEKKRRQLHKQKLYRKNKKRHKSNGKRAKSKKGDGPSPLPEFVHSSSGVLVPDGNLKEDILADGDTGTRRCDVKAEGRREMHSVGCTGSLPTGEYNASGHDEGINSVVAGDAVDLEDHHGVDDETFQTRWLVHDANRKCHNCHRRCFTDDVSSSYYFDMCVVYSHACSAQL